MPIRTTVVPTIVPNPQPTNPPPPTMAQPPITTGTVATTGTAGGGKKPEPTWFEKIFGIDLESAMLVVFGVIIAIVGLVMLFQTAAQPWFDTTMKNINTGLDTANKGVSVAGKTAGSAAAAAAIV